MIKIINLSKKITSKLIFENLNIEIPSNKITFVVGESGVGKSTLINLIAGFTAKDEGEIRFFKEGKEEKNPLIDVVFQDFNLIENLSVKNNILIGNNIIKREFDQVLLEKSANFLNIENDKLNQQVKDLSGGEKQRVAILRAFSRNSDFILLDEPTGNLDEENAVAVFESLKKLSKNKTILIASRNLKLAKKYAKQIIHIKNNSVEIENFEKNEENISKKFTFVSKIEQKPINFLKNLRTSFLLSLSNFKSKIITTIFLFFAFFAAIFMMVLSLCLFLKVQTGNVDKILEYQLDSILIRKKTGGNFLPSELEKIQKTDKNVVKIIPFYKQPYMFFSYENDENYKVNYDIDFVDESEFFSKRLKNKIGEFQGRWIRNENEMVISAEYANHLKIKNPIGKKIKFSNNFNKGELLIVGLNNSLNNQKRNLSFLHYNLIKSQLKKNKQIYDENNQIFPFLEIEDLEDISIGNKNYYEDQPEISKFKLLEGSLPKNSSQITISSTLRDFLNSKKFPIIGNVISSVSKNNGEKFFFKIVGVFNHNNQKNEINQNNFNQNNLNDTKNIANAGVIFHHSIIEKSKTFRPLFLKVFFNYKNLDKNIANFLNYYPKYEEIEKNNDKFIGEIIARHIIIYVITIILLIILLIGIIFYSINLTSSGKRIIGVLKVLGAKTWQIISYNLITYLFIAVLFLVLGIIVTTTIIPKIYQLITEQDVFFPSISQIIFYFLPIWLLIFSIFFITLVVFTQLQHKKSIEILLKNEHVRKKITKVV
ncbi:ATP-binding cassette domain-containing protein [Mesomycoplasma hyopneumoniae]|uniref:ABC transporter ATP-binding protein n=1 Tax=Mesomycoplasma hyopneumoniae (strain 7448) TaxID=262722 RepID=Q4A8Y9_MESH7|nr:ATP-binding cassette domain-containing protein [Mesomycoplasma hyopneumoniae]AAZ53400.1 ABC transporter ATP-binding protein [Mesomycoplasma hyopneumoniae 7448]